MFSVSSSMFSSAYEAVSATVGFHYDILCNAANASTPACQDAHSNASTPVQQHSLEEPSYHIVQPPSVQHHAPSVPPSVQHHTSSVPSSVQHHAPSVPSVPPSVQHQAPSVPPREIVHDIVAKMNNRLVSPTFSFICYLHHRRFSWSDINERLFNFLSNKYNTNSDAVLKECIQAFVDALMDYAHASTTPALHRLALCLEVLDMICILSQNNGDDYHSIEVVKDVVQITYKQQVKTHLEIHHTLKNVLRIECSLVRIKIIHD